MTDKHQIIQDFRVFCAKRSAQKYEFYKTGKKFLSKDSDSDIIGTMCKGESVFYAAIHNRRKMESLCAFKQIKEYQNSILDLMMFDSEGDEFEIHYTETGKSVKGQSEAVRQTGKHFKDTIEELKEILTIAMKIDNDVGYWK